MFSLSSCFRNRDSEPRSNPNLNRIYDVFISFRWEYTHGSFTSHLYTALTEVGVTVFRDDGMLIRNGDQILLQAIEGSRISIIVFSKNYASSKRCLQELEKIMECRRSMNQVVVPVFYGINPSDVCNQTGMFGEAFEDFVKRNTTGKYKVLTWRAALRDAGSTPGFVIKDSRNESYQHIKSIVERVTDFLDLTNLFVAAYPVGVESRVQEVIQLINNQDSKDVLLLGIWGMGGIGKTTIAKAIYNKIKCNFEGSEFLSDIREISGKDATHVLQEQLISAIYTTTKIKIHSIELGKEILKERLCLKKVLIVLDDVNELEQLNALCGSRKWFGPGSIIIITTRDQRLLRVIGVDHVYKMKEMDNNESVQLFSWHAFKQAMPTDGYVELSRIVVDYYGGLPLALKVIGSFLFDRSIAEWRSAMEKLRRIPNDHMQEKLRISYDGLEDTEKEIFLDIACFFIGMDKDDVIHILNDCGFFAEIGIEVLVEKGFVTIDNNKKLGMHGMLRDMGREIIRAESQREPGRRSRLWSPEDVFNVLSENSGTETVEGLTLKIPSSTRPLRTKAFRKMKKLRLLRLDGVQLDGDFKYLSRHLKWLCWQKFPLTHMPTNFYQRSLVALELEYSNLKLVWKEAQLLQKLKILNLSHSHYLTQTPDFSCLPNLEKLELKDCPRLYEVSSTIGHPNKILRINLEDCRSLQCLPRTTYKLKSLETLILSGCSKIDKLEEDLEQMESLSTLIADKTAITQVPFSIVRSKSIGYISLCGYEGFSRDVFPSIIWSWTSPTNNLSSLVQTLADMSSVVSLDLPNSSSHGLSSIFSELLRLQSLCVKCGSESQLAGILNTLDASNCKELEATPNASRVSNMKTSALIEFCSQSYISGSKGSLNSLLIQMGMNSQLTDILRDSILQEMNTSGHGDCLLPGNNYPNWLSFTNDGSCIIFHVPQVNGHNLKAMTLYIVYSSDNIKLDGFKSILIINYTKGTIQHKRDILTSFKDEEWHNVVSNWEPGDKVEVRVFDFGYRFMVKKTTVYLIYDEQIDEKMDHCHARDMNILVSGGDENSSIYDAFLSFKDEDTRATFTSLLYTSLQNAGIHVFKDDDAPPRGESISFSLQQVIKESTVSIIVLSRNYANSRWCLQELENIMLCHRTMGKLVVPVFYGVNPSEVRNQTGIFGEDFEDLLKEMSVDRDIEMSWRKALREAGDISGFVIKDSRIKSEDINNIVERVCRLLGRTDMSVADHPHPVGVEPHVQCMTQLLYRKSEEVLLLGICGMGGIGKTTLARSFYDKNSCAFDGSSFLLNIREIWEKYTRRVYLQEWLLYDIFREKIKIHGVELGKQELKNRLCRKKLLLVFDDVNKLEQLKALCESREWFGAGSRIIITTRDKRLLTEHGVDHIYTRKEMDKNDSIELFSWHAFKQGSPREDFAGQPEVTRKLVACSGGLPLALEVLGRELCGEGIAKWKSTESDRVKGIPHPEVQKVLKISYDGLDNEKEKDIFLDIAYFFIGEDRDVVKSEVSKAFGREVAESGIRVLEERSLVTIDEMNRLQMHVLLQDMGQEIIRERSRIEPGPRIYDVFLSFRGETRGTFTSYIYASLRNAGFSVFRDDDEIQGGDRIKISLLQAIRKSRCSIVVMSEKYANSRWCLVELEKIMETKRAIGMNVLPVFYQVEPSDVRNQRCTFGEAFKDLLERIRLEKDQELRWRRALRDIGGMKGDVIINSRDESKDIKKVVEKVTSLLDRTDLFVADHPVGVKSRVQDVIKLLTIKKPKGALLLGIWGMGGIGKTTIAKAIYNELGRSFEKKRSFLQDIRKDWKKDNGPVRLQEALLSNIHKAWKMKIQNIDSGKQILGQRLRNDSVLVVLDDVDKLEQLNALYNREWYGQGSKIIITTRDKHLLRVLDVDHVYELEKMDEGESTELFRWHAFKEASPGEDFAELCSAVVKYCGGLPLALEVLGSYLFKRGLEEWKSVLKKLKEIPNNQVQKKLRISFDGLSDDKEKEIFLDIAFFFIGMNRDDVIHILDDCGDYAKIGISVLIERSLITIDSENKLGMHALLQWMAKEIIREESTKRPEKRSRLWFAKEVLEVLSNHVGTKAVEGLELKLPRIKRIQIEAFKEMNKLRLLRLDGVKLVGDFEHLSRYLRWLCWHGFPSKYIAKNFYQGSLVSIELEYSNLKLVWKDTQMLEKLKILNLSHSHHLIQTPNFSYLPKLEKLVLEDCPNLSSVSHTIERLNKLLQVNFKDCTNLGELPRSFYRLTSLSTLNLSGCLRIDNLEEDLEQMESLTTLIADKTAITQVPFSIFRLKNIGYVSLCGFKGFSHDVFPSIIWSWMSPRNNLSSLVRTYVGKSSFISIDGPNCSSHGQSSTFNDLTKLPNPWVESNSELRVIANVASMDTLYSTNDKELEASATTSKVSNMKTCTSIFCPSQVENSGSKISLNSIVVHMGMNCEVTDILRESILQKLSTSGPGDCLLLGDKSTDWLSFDDEGSSVIFEVPQVNGRKLKTMMLCIVYSSSLDTTSEGLKNVLIKNCTNTTSTPHVYKQDTLTSFGDEDWQRVKSTLEAGNKVEVLVAFENGFIVKKTAVYLIYNELIDKKMENCHAPDEEDEIVEPLKKKFEPSITPESQKGHGGETSETSKSQRPIETVAQKRTRAVGQQPSGTTLSCKKTIKEQDTPFQFEISFYRNISQNVKASTVKEPNVSKNPEQVDFLNGDPSEEVSISSPQKTPEILDLIVDQTAPTPDKGKAPMEFDILDPTHDSDEDPFPELESILSGTHCSSLKSVKSSFLSIGDTSVKEALINLECLLKNSLISLLEDPELCRQLIIALDCLDDAADDLPAEVLCWVENMKTVIPHLLDRFPSTQETVHLHMKHLDRKNSLSQNTSDAKSRQEQLITKISEVKSEAKIVDLEIAEVRKRLSSLVKKQEMLAADLQKCEVEKKKLREEARQWVQDSKEVMSAIKSSEPNYKAALKEQAKMIEEWELFGKRLADNIKKLF